MPGLNYKAVGVDVGEKQRCNQRIRDLVKSTYNDRVLTESGLFAGAVSLNEFRHYARPSLHAVMRAVDSNSIQLAPGILPLAFLDYLGSSSLRIDQITSVLSSLCQQLAVPLIGGETAEMPGTFQEGCMEVVGALFGISEANEGVPLNLKGMQEPALVMSMDGVGTKTRLALEFCHYAGLLEDITHHCLNDILCLGAQGVGITFYLGGHDISERLEQKIKAPLEGLMKKTGLQCLDFQVQSRPNIYEPGEIDLCGCIAGIVDIPKALPKKDMSEGDVLLALPSNGLHTNGYTLARHALSFEDKQRFADILLLPHRTYAKEVMSYISFVKGIAHITGGGIVENLIRILPEGLGARIEKNRWTVPPIFRHIQQAASIPWHDKENKGMFETFNMGIGLILVVSREKQHLLKHLDFIEIGSIFYNLEKDPYERIIFC